MKLEKKLVLVVALLFIISAAIVGGIYMFFFSKTFTFSPFSGATGEKEAAPAGMRLLPSAGVYGRKGGVVRASSTSGAPSSPSYSFPAGRKVVMDGYVRLRVGEGEVEAIAEKAAQLAVSLGGYVGEMRVKEDSAYLLLRVPYDKFNEALEELRKLGTAVEVQTSARDVTDQYVDLEARLKVLREEGQRLLQLLERAESVKEVLEVEDYLSRIRTEIERYEAMLKNLERSIQYSSIRVYVEAPPKEPKPIIVFPKFDPLPAFATALGLLYAVIYGLIIITVGMSPLLLLGAAGYFAYTRVLKKKLQPTKKN